MMISTGVLPFVLIATRFSVGISIAVPAAILCINRRLYLLASPTSLIPTQADKIRELIIDLVIGIGLPIIVMVLCMSSLFSLSSFSSSIHLFIYSAYLVQNGRFMIAEDFGCSVPILTTWLSLLIINIPPLLLELIAGVYGCLSIHAFYNRSKLNETWNNNSDSNNFNSIHYIRLICFSACDLLCGIPITIFYLYLAITLLVPFPGLAEEHYKFSKIFELPAVVWRADTINELSFELNRWIPVWAAFVFFAIFGFTKESRNNYRTMLQVFAKSIGIKSRPSNNEVEECVFFLQSFFFIFFLFLSFFCSLI